MKKPKKYTKLNHETYLNSHYAQLSNKAVYDSFEYLTSKHRAAPISQKFLVKSIQNGLMGSVLRKNDSIAFICSYNDHKPSQNETE